MKHIRLILTILISYTTSAQDLRLFENTWYLHELFDYDLLFIPPSNDEIESVQLHFYEPDLMETSACHSLSAYVIYSGMDQFMLYNETVGIGNCVDPDNNTFTEYYIARFFEDHINNTFEYSISLQGTTRKLMIINGSNNVAIYKNKMLSTKNTNDSQFAIYPNPANEHLTITSKKNNSTTEVKILNTMGEVVRVEKILNEKNLALDIADLSSGIYFVNVRTEDGDVSMKKFIKR